jgi:hypothetical protein
MIMKTHTHQEQFYRLVRDGNIAFSAKYPGTLGNNLKVSVCPGSNGFSSWVYSAAFNGALNTSTYVANQGGSYDEMHIAVIDATGYFSGVANTVRERFAYVSKAFDATNDDGSSSYYVSVLNDQSKYIYAVGHAALGNSVHMHQTHSLGTGNTATSNVYTSVLSGGTDAVPTTAQVEAGYDFFKNTDQIDVSLIMTGGHSNVVSKYVVDNIAEVRKDCVVFISPAKTDVINKVGSEVTNITATRNAHNSSSYAFNGQQPEDQFDKYNNVYRWLPLNRDIAGLCARTDNQRDPCSHLPVTTAGQIKNVIKSGLERSQVSER